MPEKQEVMTARLKRLFNRKFWPPRPGFIPDPAQEAQQAGLHRTLFNEQPYFLLPVSP